MSGTTGFAAQGRPPPVGQRIRLAGAIEPIAVGTLKAVHGIRGLAVRRNPNADPDCHDRSCVRVCRNGTLPCTGHDPPKKLPTGEPLLAARRPVSRSAG